MTFTERLLWPELRALDQNWRRQVPIGRFTADFCSHGRKLVVEIDGGVHRLEEVALRDATRDDWLRSQGYRVLRFTAREVELKLSEVVRAIEAG